MNEPVEIAGHRIAPGERARFDLPVARLPTDTWLSIPVEVVNGRRDGKRLWLSGAIHGDELNGVEIIRQVIEAVDPDTLGGVLIAVPIVNVFGFIEQSRYLPDRRDLNRSFPGTSRGSLAARLAYLFMNEIVLRCTHGIDLHTGSYHRDNLPQIRADLRDDEARRIALSFGAPVVVNSQTRDGSLRQAASELGIHTLLYEAGEALRFDARAIQIGVRGVERVMNLLGMIKTPKQRRTEPTVVCEKTMWVRARRSGILRLEVALGQEVSRKQRLGLITGAFGDNRVTLTAPADGIVIGRTNNPLVSQGDAIVHLARQEGGAD